jgi:NAD(P)H-flavin reductase
MSAAAPDDAMLPLPYRVARANRESADTVTLELVPVRGEMPSFQPGQFNMLYAFGAGESAISLSGDPADPGRFVHTVRAVGAVSRALASLEAGATIGLRGPFGTAWPVAAARGMDVVLVAGGLGLAPLRPAIHAVMNHRDQYGRVIILAGMRNPAEILFRQQLEHWRSRLDVELEVTVDHADDLWHGHVGVVTALVPRAGLDPGRTVAMVCGPEIMMRYTVNALRDAGVPAERIHLSLERNMKCAIGQCGHCQFGPHFVCKDGPVFPYARIAPIFTVREI